MDLPTGTVTLLFTDIEGSTKLWEQHPESMRQALARHDAILREAIESNGGMVFKTVGDAFCSAFATALDALNAALAAQCALIVEPWAGGLSLRTRMALHTGTPEEHDNDYFGPPLNRVARLLAIGYGGQVLLSRAATNALRDRLPEGCSLTDMRVHQLRDLQQPEHVWQLMHPSLPSDFPPLRSLHAFANNLPVQPTSFIGREKEMEEIKRLLDTTPLLTLTGSGGCGKTRLALQVAADLVEGYPDGVWLVELATLLDGRLVPQTVASALGLHEEPGRPLTRTLTDYVPSKSLLLLLDNCEHLLAPCAQLADTLLRACPNVKILATSREGLNTAGERTYRVPSLSLPEPRQAAAVETLLEYEAVHLFVERATFHLPTFTLTDANAPALTAVCHRLDGIPLAIELAAARVRSLSVKEIYSRLDQVFRLLTGGSRTALPRQQTLRAMLDWSYDLLNAQEKALLGRLSVFAGGWTLEAAEQVCCDFGLPIVDCGWTAADDQIQNPKSKIQKGDVLDLLTSLLDKSLVVVETQGSESRYRLLETTRQYARDKLQESDETAVVRNRHTDYFLGLAEEAEDHLIGREQMDWYGRLEAERDNLRAALAYSLESNLHSAASGSPGISGEAGLRLAGALWVVWYVRGDLNEGMSWLEKALSSNENAFALSRAKALNGLGSLLCYRGNFALAREVFEKGLALCRESGDRRRAAWILNGLGSAYLGLGDYASAQRRHEESLALFRALAEPWGVAWTLTNLGMVSIEQGDDVVARSLCEQSLALFRVVGERWGTAWTLTLLGTACTRQADYAMARSFLEESLAIKHMLGNRPGAAHSLNDLGNVALNQGDYAAARKLYTESLAISREMGHRRGIAQSVEQLAGLAETEGKLERATRLLAAVESLYGLLGALPPPDERTAYDGKVASVRAALDDMAFAAAWAEGRAMTMEQAIAYAREESAPPPPKVTGISFSDPDV